MRTCRPRHDGSRKKSWLRNTSGSPGSSLMFCSAAKVWLSRAEAWQLVQYWPKPEKGSGLSAAEGQPRPLPYQQMALQTQPSYAVRLSRTMTAMPATVGLSRFQSMPPQAAAGAVYISLTMMAPGGTGVSVGTPSTGRFVFSHWYASGEDQTSTG